MDKKTAGVPVLPNADEKGPTFAEAPTKTTVQQKKVPSIWFWLCIVIIIAALIIGGVSSFAGIWIKNIKVGATPAAIQVPITALNVQRTAPYAGITITVLNAQYALFFNDDNIRPGPATVRLNLLVKNQGTDQARIMYYDSARLIIPNARPIAPTNISLSVGPKPGKSENGWLDFAVPKGTRLDTLTLQLGSTTMSESLVVIPFKGPFDASRYTNKTYAQNTTFSYNFNDQTLNYHLTSIEARYSYQGSQCKVGQQFYVFNFSVENPEGVDVNPGFGFDYLRLVINGYSQPPIDNSLPSTFKAGSNGTTGHVVFTGPANMHAFTLGFLSQNGNGQQNFDVHAS
jgi:hypothetical protein